jgi:hypothetical protein
MPGRAISPGRCDPVRAVVLWQLCRTKPSEAGNLDCGRLFSAQNMHFPVTKAAGDFRTDILARET